jgi:hypothetical protein
MRTVFALLTLAAGLVATPAAAASRAIKSSERIHTFRRRAGVWTSNSLGGLLLRDRRR